MGSFLSKTQTHKTNPKDINLSHCRLKSIPIDTEETSQIQNLNLSFNNIHELNSDYISTFTSLKSLDVSSNQLIRIPNGLDSIPIENLNVSHNFISEIPHHLVVTNQLVNLSIGYCRLRSLPPEIGLLSELRCLIMCSNSIESLPKEIGKLVNLKSLDLNDNLLSHLPETIGQLKNLTWINLSHNLLEELPTSFQELKNLEQIGLANNALTELFDLGIFKNLITLSAFANQIQCLNFKETPMKLERLELSANLLTFVTERVFYCPRLKYINLKNNRIQIIEHCQYTIEPLLVSSCLLYIDVSENFLVYLPHILSKLSNQTMIFECHGNPFDTKSKISNRKFKLPTLQMMSFAQFLRNNPCLDVLPFYIRPEVNAYSICDHCGIVYPSESTLFDSFKFNSSCVPFLSKYCSQTCFFYSSV